MDMDHDDNFDFSDDDWDDLPANTLQQLETAAIRATQQVDPAAAAQDSAYYEPDEGGEDEVVNLADPRLATSHYPNGDRANDDYGYANGQEEHERESNPVYGEAMELEELPPQTQVDVGRLLERIKKLEQEKRRLNLNLESASAEVIKKTGEADNLRRRTEAATRAAEQRYAAQQQEHQASNGRLAAERDALLRQLEQAKTNSAFDEYNRHEDQLRRPRRVVPSRPKTILPATTSPAATPKKAQKTLPVGDGFDDDDVVMFSPTKRRDRSKAATPKQANKRKRQVPNDSPIAGLQLSEPRNKPKSPPPVSVDTKVDITRLRSLWKDDQRFTLLQRLLSHRCSKNSDRILEALTQYALPSAPHKKLSSITYDSLSSATPSNNARELAISICRVFIRLWKQCLQERYHAPTYLILDAFHFILACEPAHTTIEIMVEIIPLVVESVKLVAVPVYEARNRNDKKTAFLFSEPYQTTVMEIDVPSCLELLYLAATRCISSRTSDSLTRFWRSIPLDFVLLVLLKEQPMTDMMLLLRVLSISALSNSLGPIVSEDQAEQARGESNLLSRLTNLFFEDLAPINNPKAPCVTVTPEYQVWKVRLQVLNVLTQFSIPEYGSTALIQHNLCIGRLIKYLNYCVASLYMRPLSPTQDHKIASINATMKLLNHLTASNPGFNIKSKLNETLGGLHAYYVALTRLAFSEGLVLEAGIEQEVVDMAHDILDDGLSPEEGDALAEVFPSGNSV